MPEIADGLVVIRGVAREAGWRSKIAVVSNVQGVDPVGACVGPRGSRVRMVVSELRGEKIDIIPHNDEPARFVAKALLPARVREVLVDDDDRQAVVVVPDDQLSLAIGKEGMNARLAARLTGWRIDIKSETTFDQEEADAEYGGTARASSAAAARRCCATASAASTRPCPARATARCRTTPRSRRRTPSRPPCPRPAPRPVRRRGRGGAGGHAASRPPRPRAPVPRLRDASAQARARPLRGRARGGRRGPGA